MSQGGTEMKKAMISAIMLAVLAVTGLIAEDHKDKNSSFQFDPNSLVLSRSVYTGTAATVTVGQVLPPGCQPVTIAVPLLAGGTANVKVKCASAVDNGEYPNL